MTVSHIHTDTEPDLDSLDANEVLDQIPGLTYRQLDYWTMTGRLHPVNRRPYAGSGIHRRWPQDQVRIAKHMLRLIDHGLTLDTARAIATNHEVRVALLAELTKIEAEQETP